jgi:hypothetical protein
LIISRTWVIEYMFNIGGLKYTTSPPINHHPSLNIYWNQSNQGYPTQGIPNNHLPSEDIS